MEEGKEADVLSPAKYRDMNLALGLHGREKEIEYQKIVCDQRKNR